MECSESGTIRDEELFAYLAGEKVRPTVVQHLAHCQRCAAQLAEYRRIELKLTNILYRWDCPLNQILGEYQLGLLSKEQAVEVKNHLSRCVLCAAELATLTEFLKNDPVLAEPAAVSRKRISVRPSSNHHPVQDAKRALDDLRKQAGAGTQGVRRIAATLLPQQPRLAFQRNQAADLATWPRSYTAEDVNVSIQVERDSSRRNSLQVIGFVTRKGSVLEALQGTPVQLTSPTHAVYTQNIDELGNFVFSSVVPAIYTLEVQFPERIIIIDQLSMTAQD